MNEQSAGPVAHTDGSCLGTPGRGGWGVHVEYPDGRVVELGGGELETTNNRMELRAAIEAARATAGWPTATIITDSQYVRRGITEWIAGWKRKGWMTSTGQPVVNRDLWEELDAIADSRITWEWTRGHSGDPGNERCDAIAAWFSSSILPLSGGVNGRSSVVPASRPGPASGSRVGAVRPSGASYVSLVDGIVERHQTWSDCERRVKGVGGARYKKVRNAAEEQETFAKWGLTANDLFGV